MQPSSAAAEGVDAALVAPFDHATEPAGDAARGGVDPEQAPGLPGHLPGHRRRRARKRATVSGTTSPRWSWPGPRVPSGSTSWWRTATWPRSRRDGSVRWSVRSRASAPSWARRSKASAQVTPRIVAAATSVPSSRPWRSRTPGPGPLPGRSRAAAPSAGGRQNGREASRHDRCRNPRTACRLRPRLRIGLRCRAARGRSAGSGSAARPSSRAPGGPAPRAPTRRQPPRQPSVIRVLADPARREQGPAPRKVLDPPRDSSPDPGPGAPIHPPSTAPNARAT